MRPFPTSVVLSEGFPIRGEILLSDIRSLEMPVCRIRCAGPKAPPEVAQAAREKLKALIEIQLPASITRSPAVLAEDGSGRLSAGNAASR